MANDLQFGQQRPHKGKQSVTGEIKKALNVMLEAPQFGDQKQRIVDLLALVEAREKHGIGKYGTTLETWNGRDPLVDCLEEDLDKLQYHVQARLERADLLEQVRDLKAKNAKLERSLDEANHAIGVLQRAPGAGIGQPAEAQPNATMRPKDALLGVLCSTGVVPDSRWLDVKDALSDFFLACYANSALHGFWGPDAEDAIKKREISQKSFGVIPEKLVLMHSELSEALEAYRDMDNINKQGHDWLYYKLATGKAEGFLAELADVVIRIGDTVGSMHLEEQFCAAMQQKMKYNAQRPRMHGKTC